jgi:hypothetical protein
LKLLVEKSIGISIIWRSMKKWQIKVLLLKYQVH